MTSASQGAPRPTIPRAPLRTFPTIELPTLDGAPLVVRAALTEPLPHTPLTREHLLRADGHDPRHTEVHAVTRVLGTDRARGTRRTYAPLHDLSPEPGAPRC